MNTKILTEYQEWCIKIRKLSKGTTRCYTNNLSCTADFTLNDTYETIFKILNKRIKNNPSKMAHCSYIQFLNGKETSFDKKRYSNILLIDIKGILLNKQKNNNVDDIQDKILTKEQVSTIYDYIENLKSKIGKSNSVIIFDRLLRLHNLLYFRILYESAGRPEEVRQYNWNMIDYNNKIINVPKTITKRNKKRVAEISDKTVKLLQEYSELHIKQFGIHKKLFFNFKTYKTVKTFIKYVGIHAIKKHVTPYFFKHSFMTHKTIDALRNGVHKAIIIEDLKTYVRHSDTKTTEIYITIADRFKQKRILERYGEVP